VIGQNPFLDRDREKLFGNRGKVAERHKGQWTKLKQVIQEDVETEVFI